MTNPAPFRHWIDLSEDDIRNMLIALVGFQFGPEPETRIPEIRDSRKHYANYVADQARITSDDTVLDLGCGCGFGTYHFAQRAKNVHACDISPAFLSFATRECSKLGNVSFHLIQPRRLECLEANSIDVACAMSLFIHFNLYDVYWYFHEFARVVRPAGRIWIDIADSESLDLTTPNANGGYFLKHAAKYRDNDSSLPGLMQWNSTNSVVQIADQCGFDNLDRQPDGRLLFAKRSTTGTTTTAVFKSPRLRHSTAIRALSRMKRRFTALLNTQSTHNEANLSRSENLPLLRRCEM